MNASVLPLAVPVVTIRCSPRCGGEPRVGLVRVERVHAAGCQRLHDARVQRRRQPDEVRRPLGLGGEVGELVVGRREDVVPQRGVDGSAIASMLARGGSRPGCGAHFRHLQD